MTNANISNLLGDDSSATYHRGNKLETVMFSCRTLYQHSRTNKRARKSEAIAGLSREY